LAHERPARAITLPQDETVTGGLCLVGVEPVRNSILLEQAAPARDHAPWQACMEPALAGLNGKVIQATSDEAPGVLAYVAQHLGAHPSPDLCHVPQALSKAVAAPMAAKQRAAARALKTAEETLQRVQEFLDAPAQRGPGRPPKAASLAQGALHGVAARHAYQRLAGQRETVAQSIRASGHAYPFVDLERGVRRKGKLIAGDSQRHIDTIRTVAQQEPLRQVCLERSANAARGVPQMPATSEFVSGYGHQQVRHVDWAAPVSYAMHAQLISSYSLERVASPQTGTPGEPLRALAEPLRTPLLASGGALEALSPAEQNQRKAQAATLAEGFQRSSSNVEGRHGDLSLRHHQRRGLDRARKRACLTAGHNFLLTRPAGTTAAERFFGQKPRSMLAAILDSVAIPPAPLSPPRRALG